MLSSVFCRSIFAVRRNVGMSERFFFKLKEMDEENTLRLAALLHDIGKFWQGVGEPHDSRYNHLTPEDYGKHGAHAKWSASFVVNYLPEEFQNCESLA